jgi:glycosyltransferase involved in cell wall biosynthesis
VRVCYFGTYDPAFARNALLRAGLRAAGATVLECRAPLWRGTADKLAAARGAAPGLGRRLAAAWRALIAQHRALGEYDVLVVGYAGHLDVLLAQRLAGRRGRPVVLDAFLSLVETLEDRGLARAGAARWHAARLLDRLACRRADRVLVDTGPHAAYFARALGIPPERLAVVPMGAWPRAPLPPPPAAGFHVAYVGGYIPLHGLEYVLGAAERLAALPDVRFTLVGNGQEYAAVRALAARRDLHNVEFARVWLPEDELVARYLAPAHVCLGVFGASAKAARVVPAKVLLALAAGRPVVTRDSPAAREALRAGEHALLCPPADADALAAALRRLRDDPALRARLAAAGPPLVAARYAPAPLGRRLLAILEAAVAERAGADAPPAYPPAAGASVARSTVTA